MALSDHKGVLCSSTLDCLNMLLDGVSILKNESYITQFIAEFQIFAGINVGSVEDPRILWDAIKGFIRCYAILFCSNACKARSLQLQNLEAEFTRLGSLLQTNFTDQIALKRSLVKKEINNIPRRPGAATPCPRDVRRVPWRLSVFNFQPQTFPTDVARVAYIITQLTGWAKRWGTAAWIADLPCLQTSGEFMTEMQRMFGCSATGLEAGRELLRLCQGHDTVSNYSIEFQTLATDSGWEGQALVDAFLHRLAESVKDELLMRDLPDDLE